MRDDLVERREQQENDRDKHKREQKTNEKYYT